MGKPTRSQDSLSQTSETRQQTCLLPVWGNVAAGRRGELLLQKWQVLQPLQPLLPQCSVVFRQSSREYNNLQLHGYGSIGRAWFCPPSVAELRGDQWENMPLHSTSYVAAITQMLNQINTYAHHLRALSQIPTAKASLYICWRDESSEITAIIHRGVGPEAGSWTVAFWKTSDQQPTFIQPTNILYEPLQYPLFFPHSCPGWHCDLLTLNPDHSARKVSKGRSPASKMVMRGKASSPSSDRRTHVTAAT